MLKNPFNMFFATVIVVAGSQPAIIRAMAWAAKIFLGFWGNRIQICDGVDDQAQIIAAAAVGGHILVTDGSFYFSAVADLDNNNYLQGQGDTTVFIMGDGITGDICIRTSGKSGVKISDLKIDGQKAAQTGVQLQEAIRFISTTDSEIRNVLIVNVGTTAALSGYGIYLNGSSRNIIANCRLSGCKRENLCLYSDSDKNLVVGVIAKDGEDRNFVIHDSADNELTSCQSMNSAGNGIEIISLGSARHNTITGCTIHTAVIGINLLDIASVQIEGCLIRNTSSYGISIPSTAIRPVIVGCKIYNAVSYGIYCLTSNALIADNLLSAGTAAQISITGSYCTILGNIVIDGVNRGIEMLGGTYNAVVGNIVNNDASSGIYISGDYNVVSANSLIDNGGNGGGEDNGISLSGTADNNLIVDNTFNKGTTQIYGIRIFGGATANVIRDNQLANAGTTYAIGDAGTGTIIRNNRGYLASGEERSVSGALIAGVADAFCFAWQNPESVAVIVTKVVVDVTTAGGTVNSVLHAGSAADATTESDNLIDGADLNAIAVYDNLNDAGVNGKSKQKLAASGGATDWVTGRIKVANASLLAGKYYIHYTGV